MKKSIKYAGIAAATLLAVAPVAAPVVSNVSTTIVKADALSDAQAKLSDAQSGLATKQAALKTAQDAVTAAGDAVTAAQKQAVTDAQTAVDTANKAVTDAQAAVKAAQAANDVTNENIKNAVNSLKGVFTDVTYGDNSSNGEYPEALTDRQYDSYMSSTDALALKLLNGKTISSADAAVLADTEKANAQVKLFAVDGNGNKINYNDYSKLVSSVSSDNGSITYKYTIKYNDKDGDAQTPVTGTFKLTNDNNYTEVKTLNVTYTDPISVAYGSKTVNTKLSTTIDGVVKDQNGNTIELDNDASTTKAGDLFKSLKSAINNDTSDEYTDSTFGNEDKTYYQPVTITIKGDKMGNDKDSNPVTAQSILKAYLDGEDNYNVTVNGKQLSALTANILKANDTNTLTFIRKVNVTQNASWTTEKVSGVVTTKSDTAYKTLVNDDNNTIANRALAANTPWRTDEKRTDQNGNVQYRVATGEWVNANDVTFVKDGDATGAYTDKQSISGTVHLENKNNYYFLYDDNGNLVTSRGLNGDSDWHTDTVAKNASGVTVYRVATNEWVQVGTGVSFK